MRRRITVTSGAAVAALALAGGSLPAALARDGEARDVKRAARCSLGSAFTLKLSPEDGRVEVEVEVDDISARPSTAAYRPGPTSSAGSPRRSTGCSIGRRSPPASKESFVADASHEMKTPITALEGHARLAVRAIDRGDLPRARESADVVLEQTPAPGAPPARAAGPGRRRRALA